MKEKDVVDFTKLKENDRGYLVDENNEEIGCEICYTHEKAYDLFKKDEDMEEIIPRPRCPICGEYLTRRDSYTTDKSNAVVSEVNYSNPDGNIGFYSIWECEICSDQFDNNQLFALMPEPITWNANHDIYYTGGSRYCVSSDIKELLSLIKKHVIPSITQYTERVLHPKNAVDKNLSEWNLKLWCSYDIEHAIAEWLYKHGWKK